MATRKTDRASLSRYATTLMLWTSLLYALPTFDSVVAAATCGDGIRESPEDCDDGDTLFQPGDYCSAACSVVPCGIPTAPEATKPKAADALFTLRAAVGQVGCDLRVCDVNQSSTVTATDALTILKAAVGLPVELACSSWTTSTTLPPTTIPTTTTTTTAPTTTLPETTTTTAATPTSTTITPTTSTSTTTVYVPPECGATELCGPRNNVALDEDCDGEVDESPDCSCVPGSVQGCFKGDPSYLGTSGCYPGTQTCGDTAVWDACIGGVHATDACFAPDATACHAISAYPFATVNLRDGVGEFGADALSESWTVTCPPGATSCPAVGATGPVDNFQPIASGEYTVTYEKITSGGQQGCSYPLVVGMRGLRVELDWEHDLGETGVDLDLHVHEPGSTDPWGGDVGSPHDCAWSNCTVASCGIDACPEWFFGLTPPDPVRWSLFPTLSENGCYFAPGGRGAEWQSLARGCHNPRLDTENITCDPLVNDPDAPDFCLPENINIDFPPRNQWIRIGVHYYSNHGQSYDVHPRVRVFCNGALAGDLGPGGYGIPQTPVAFPAADGSTLYWLVADVLFYEQGLSDACSVKPLYADAGDRTPLLATVTAVQSSFSPPYPTTPN